MYTTTNSHLNTTINKISTPHNNRAALQIPPRRRGPLLPATPRRRPRRPLQQQPSRPRRWRPAPLPTQQQQQQQKWGWVRATLLLVPGPLLFGWNGKPLAPEWFAGGGRDGDGGWGWAVAGERADHPVPVPHAGVLPVRCFFVVLCIHMCYAYVWVCVWGIYVCMAAADRSRLTQTKST